MLWLVFILAIAVLFFAIWVAFRVGPHKRDVDEGSEMEEGKEKGAEEEEMKLRSGIGSVGVRRTE